MFVKGQVKRKCNFVFHGQNIGNLSAVPPNTSMKEAIFRLGKEENNHFLNF